MPVSGYLMRSAMLVAALSAPFCTNVFAVDGPESTVWVFDRLENIGGNPTSVVGEPKVIDTPAGKAVEFDGIDDELVVHKHPLAGFQSFTFEVIFRPDGGGDPQPRWFHLSTMDSATGELLPNGNGRGDSNPRFTFELRIVDGKQFYMESFTSSPRDGYSKALIFPDKLHPVGRWYVATQTYDGKVYRSYVNGVLEGEAEIAYKPQGPGRASIGGRLNRVFFFDGAVMKARFTSRALDPSEFLKVPEGLPRE